MNILNSLKFFKKNVDNAKNEPISNTNKIVFDTKSIKVDSNPYKLNPIERAAWMWKTVFNIENVVLNTNVVSMPVDQWVNIETGGSAFQEFGDDHLKPDQIDSLKNRFKLGVMYLELVKKQSDTPGNYSIKTAIVPQDIYIGFREDEFEKVEKGLHCGVMWDRKSVDNPYFGNAPKSMIDTFETIFETSNPKYQQIWFIREIDSDNIKIQKSVKPVTDCTSKSFKWFGKQKSKLQEVAEIKTEFQFDISKIQPSQDENVHPKIVPNPSLEIFENYSDLEIEFMQQTYFTILQHVYREVTAFVVVGGFQSYEWDKRHGVMQSKLDCLTPLYLGSFSNQS